MIDPNFSYAADNARVIRTECYDGEEVEILAQLDDTVWTAEEEAHIFGDYDAVNARLAELEAEHHADFEADWKAAERMNVAPYVKAKRVDRKRDRSRDHRAAWKVNRQVKQYWTPQY